MKAAKKMGIPDAEIHIFNGLNSQELNKMIRRECLRYLNFAYDGKKVFHFVYCCGHGVEDNQQFFCLNDEHHNLLAIEQKLRCMAKGSEGMFSILAVYDICRSNL